MIFDAQTFWKDIKTMEWFHPVFAEMIRRAGRIRLFETVAAFQPRRHG